MAEIQKLEERIAQLRETLRRAGGVLERAIWRVELRKAEGELAALVAQGLPEGTDASDE